MTDDKGNLVWFGDYYGWGKLKSETYASYFNINGYVGTLGGRFGKTNGNHSSNQYIDNALPTQAQSIFKFWY